MKISVGTQNSDIPGSDNRSIQKAVDQVSAAGGGTVFLQAGTYVCHDSVRMKSHVRLMAEPETVTLIPGPTPISYLAMDADIGERQITPISTEGFYPGLGVILRDDDKPHAQARSSFQITRIENGTLYIDDWIVHDWIAENGGRVIGYGPLIHSIEQEDIEIDGLILDGHRADAPEELKTLRGQNLYCKRTRNITIRNCISRNAYGDGFRFGTSSNVVIEDCEVHHNRHYGVHPGSHTRPVRFSGLHIHHNEADGLYVCWGVQNSIFENCHIHHNGGRVFRSGFSIGHKDSDNRIEGNHIHDNAKYGIAIRQKTEANGAHRNHFINNRIENNGTLPQNIPAEVLAWLPAPEKIGAGIDVQGITQDLVFEKNIVRDTRQGNERTQVMGIQLHEGLTGLVLKDNECTPPVNIPPAS